jgi:hypothetical protein
VWSSAQVPARIEATALDGRMVTFEILGPWRSDSSRRLLETGAAGTPIGRLSEALGQLRVPIAIVVFVTGAFFARRNLRMGRGDRRGATTLALIGSAAMMGSWLFIGRGFIASYAAMGFTLGAASFVWVAYVAVEPFVRRRWPTMLVAWVRVLAGNVRVRWSVVTC